MIKEALILFYLDDLDSKMNIFMKTISEDENEDKWTSAENYFGVPLYKG